MARFYPLPIQAIQQETADCKSIEFALPASLQDAFTFKQGQHLTLRTTLNGEDIRRNYSLCSSPQEGVLRIAVKQIEGGKFSTFANEQLTIGDVLEVMPPAGKFYTDLDPNQRKQYAAFVAGSGITPVLSILKSVLETEPDSTFTLFYVNKQVQSIIFKEEIEGLKNKYLERLQVYYFLTQEELDIPLFNGRFSKEKMDWIFGHLISAQAVDEYFLCGPEQMIADIRSNLEHRSVSPRRIHFELFTASTPIKQRTQVAKPTHLQDTTSEIVVRDGGKQFTFQLKPGTESILDAALKKGADLPFACKGGVCCTCKAKIISGEVEMDVNYALEPEEVEAGYVLACQSHPLTSKVVIDFDQAL